MVPAAVSGKVAVNRWIRLFRRLLSRLTFSVFLLAGCHRTLAAAPALDFLYIDSSVDEAAGGHAAVRFDQTVFHYQFYPEGYFLMVKEPWEEFRYQYNDLQNRTIAIASLSLAPEIYRQVFESFQNRYIRQECRFSHLADLEREVRFYRLLAAGFLEVPVDGLGLFARQGAGDPDGSALRAHIDRALGPEYLETVAATVSLQLSESRNNLRLTPGDVPEPPEGGVSFTPCRSRQYFDLKSLQQAITVLINCRPLAADALLSPAGNGGSLTLAERAVLEKYGDRLRDSVVSLLRSRRPDRGRILLLQAARFQAVRRSLAADVLYTLDPFGDQAEVLDLPQQAPVQWEDEDRDNGAVTVTLLPSGEAMVPPVVPRRSFIRQLIGEGERMTRLARKALVAGAHPEIVYNQLEIAQGKLADSLRAEQEGTPVRMEAGALLPSRSRYLVERYSPGSFELAQQVMLAEKNLEEFKRHLHTTYHYNLFTRNCVTELFTTAYGRFDNPEQIRRALGGYLEPGGSFSFVPFLCFRQVCRNFDVSSSRILPSFRLRQLQRNYENSGILERLREANTLTSTLYTPWEQDSVFLFFTDDVVWDRPVLGAANLAYSAVGTLGGIAALPFDRGLLFKRGVRGMMFSLPELAFFNIRKGTYPAIARSDE